MNSAPGNLSQLLDLMNRFSIVDLNHIIEERIPAWPTHPKFFINRWEDYVPDLSRMNQWVIGEHTGTHMDSPLHFVQEGHDAHYGIDAIPLTSCMGRCAKIDCTALDESGLVTEKIIVQWEGSHGNICEGDIVLLNYGWASKWKTGPTGNEFVARWPGLDHRAALYLQDKGIKAIGTDTLSIDHSDTETFPAHNVLLHAQIPIIENLNNLKELPDFSYFMALPIKVKDASGSPVRAIALIEK